MTHRDVFVVSTARTAIGTFGGSLKDVPNTQLATTAVKAAIARSGLAPDAVGHVVMGNVIPTDTKDAYLSRVAAIDAGCPIETPAFNVNRLCGSGLQARAAQAVDVEGGRLDGAAGVDGGHAAQVGVLGVGGDHVAHDHMAHGVGRQARAGDGCLHGGGCELGVGHVFEAAAKGADGGAGGADNENVAVGHVKGSVEKWVKS